VAEQSVSDEKEGGKHSWVSRLTALGKEGKKTHRVERVKRQGWNSGGKGPVRYLACESGMHREKGMATSAFAIGEDHHPV